MAVSLVRFSPDEVFLTNEETFQILTLFWPDQPLAPGSTGQADRAFAQALLVEAADRSEEMGYVEVIFQTAFSRIPRGLDVGKALIRKIAQRALRNYFRAVTKKNLEDPKLYAAVVTTLARNFRSVWAIRLQTGELDY